jgi:hypothetical protein
MRSPFDHMDHALRVAPATDERTLYVRVHGEFREMPGLTLTVRQAARLCSEHWCMTESWLPMA